MGQHVCLRCDEGENLADAPNNKFQVIAEYLPGPSDLGIDQMNHLILVPLPGLQRSRGQWPESPTVSTGDRAKRTLADYGFVEPKKSDKEGSPEKMSQCVYCTQRKGNVPVRP